VLVTELYTTTAVGSFTAPPLGSYFGASLKPSGRTAIALLARMQYTEEASSRPSCISHTAREQRSF